MCTHSQAVLHGLQMGPGQSLMHLASDAVRAAAESPFLEEAVKRASAILCCISMPSPKQRFAGLHTKTYLSHCSVCCTQHLSAPMCAQQLLVHVLEVQLMLRQAARVFIEMPLLS